VTAAGLCCECVDRGSRRGGREWVSAFRRMEASRVMKSCPRPTDAQFAGASRGKPTRRRPDTSACGRLAVASTESTNGGQVSRAWEPQRKYRIGDSQALIHPYARGDLAFCPFFPVAHWLILVAAQHVQQRGRGEQRTGTTRSHERRIRERRGLR